jgi:hypothetical protein
MQKSWQIGIHIWQDYRDEFGDQAGSFDGKSEVKSLSLLSL